EINTISKATLLLAIKQLQETHPEIDYFPSYEIMMDDLRDYRFYKADMLHPSEVAIQYIWGLFSDRYFDSRTQAFIINWQSIIQAFDHQLFHAQTPCHTAFNYKTVELLNALGNMTDISA